MSEMTSEEMVALCKAHSMWSWSRGNDVNPLPVVRTEGIYMYGPDGERWIDLQKDMPGVSRRHCLLQTEGGQCIVRDFSRYGTFLNGHRIDGSAVLQVGDLIRLGTPGFELRLITTEQARGS